MPAAGDRVVVRHLLASGQATDVIGILIDDGDPVIVERDGLHRAIDRSAIVAVKTVPARPVRASEIRSLDLARARSWWSLEQQWIDGWLCRAAPGYSGARSGCAAPLHPDASPAGLDPIREWFASRSLPLRLTVSERLLRGADPGGADPALETVVLVTDRVPEGSADGPRGVTVRFADSPSPQWLALTGVPQRLAESVDGAVSFASIDGADGGLLAAARLSITADAAGALWGGIGAVTVAAGYPGADPGPELVRGLAAYADAAGARRLFTEAGPDDPALARFRDLGFAQHHRSHTWTEL
ncbi:GNAT family N-acetyltransferase [Tsukamurella serpentis]